MRIDEIVAVLGAGSTIGFGMARNIARAGFRVRAWNRTVEKARALEDDGAAVSDTPREAADGADVIVTMLAEGLGLDPNLLLDAIEGGPLDLPYLRMKSKAIMARSFEPSFRLTLAAKDARLIEESAQRRGIDTPLFSTIRRRLADGARDHGDEDFSATYLTSAPHRTGA